jgi:hydroxymethylglutaryl-CoA reductase
MIVEHEEKWLEMIDSAVESASDDELFAGGYLRGHISLSAADCETQGVDDLETFKKRVQESLEEARSELTPADRIIVADLWNQLKNS